MRLFIGLMIMILAGALTSAAQTDNMKAFPPASAGMVRYVWNPPALQNENDAKIEIIVGKMASVDPINKHFLMGSIREENIEGWGFSKYVVTSNGTVGGTLMAVPPGTKNVTKLVTLRSDAQLFRYNSRLPVVIYAPEGLTVRLRVWRPGGKNIEVKVG